MRTIVPPLFALVVAGCSCAGVDLDASTLDASTLDASARDGTVSTTDAAGSDGAAPDAPAARTLRVLFIGNSYTRFNDLPEIVREIGATLPDSVTLEVDSVLVDGATLTDHYNTTGARARIRDGHFDFVVIQAQSTEPLRPLSGFLFSAGAFTDDVAATGAHLVWFVTWARRAGSPDYASTDLRDPQYMTQQLEAEYGSAFLYGHRLGVITSAHVGIAFQIAIAEHPEIDLYNADGSHPTPAGSVLAGCVITQMITGVTPHVPSPAPAGVDQHTAETLCAIAPRVACLGANTFCGGTCVSLAGDPLNCGACGNVCSGDLPCVDASCHCPDPETSPCAHRGCANLHIDPMNCGACGRTCALGQSCESGTCVCRRATLTQWVDTSELTALRAGCVRGSETWQPECFAAASAWCARSSCFDTGIGPLAPATFAPGGTITCTTSALRTITYAELAAIVPECNGSSVVTTQPCVTAIHRACLVAGAVSGFGPVGGDATSIEIACLRSATLTTVSFADLASRWSMCDGTTIRGGRDCAFASHLACAAAGHASGYGPVEVSGGSATIVCLDR